MLLFLQSCYGDGCDLAEDSHTKRAKDTLGKLEILSVPSILVKPRMYIRGSVGAASVRRLCSHRRICGLITFPGKILDRGIPHPFNPYPAPARGSGDG